MNAEKLGLEPRRLFSRRGGVATYRIPAEMTLEGTRAFRAYVAATLANRDSLEVDLSDLTDVAALEAGLLAALVAADKSARAVRAGFCLLGVHGAVANALAVTGLNRYFEIPAKPHPPLGPAF